MKYIKVENKDGLVRDSETSAILNVDTESYDQYVRTYQNKLRESKKIKDLEDEISDIKSDINEIKNLLREALK